MSVLASHVFIHGQFTALNTTPFVFWTEDKEVHTLTHSKNSRFTSELSVVRKLEYYFY